MKHTPSALRANRRLSRPVLGTIAALGLFAAACGSDEEATQASSSNCFSAPDTEAIETIDADLSGTTITLATHGSFALSDETLETFTNETGIAVELVTGADAGQLVSESILTKDSPTADVLFGIDNALMCRGLEADIFLPHSASGLDEIDQDLVLDPHHRLTPIDTGDVCVNYRTDAIPADAPTDLDDLIDPANEGQFVTQNPETSSPGFGFLLATIAKYGEDGWENYWQSLVDNDVEIVAGWDEAYFGSFQPDAGRSIVTSYASSPPVDVIFSDPQPETAPTAVVEDSCFRQIEFAGVLAGTEHPEAAAALIDFMLSDTYQADLPGNQFVYPVNTSVALPPEFEKFGPPVEDSLTLDPAEIEANREDWIDRWNDIVLG